MNRYLISCFYICFISTHLWAANVYDPDITWKTIHTSRFVVNYPDGARNLAIRISRISEEVYDDIINLFGFTPEGKIDIVLTDASDLANGSAQVIPKNTIRLQLTAPTELTGLSSYNDWLRILLIHEITHIVDIDQTWGITRFLRSIFGKYIQMNSFTPQFLSEGAGVYAETILTNTGRGRSSYVSMILRMMALEDRFLSIDQAHIFHSQWPGGNVAYFFGGRFHLFLADKYGKDKVKKLHQYYASMPIPYIYFFGAKSVFGKSLDVLWEEWRKYELDFAQEVQANVMNEGVTKTRRITFLGGSITGARYSPCGQYIIYSRYNSIEGATVRRINRDGSDDHYIVLQTFSPRFSFSSDGQYFYFSQNAINKRFNNYNDIYQFDIKEKKIVRLKDKNNPEKSLRARDPNISMDGKEIIFVQNKLYQNFLSIGEIDADNREEMTVKTLIYPKDDMQFSSPEFSPDKSSIAVSVWFNDGKRDIIVLDTKTGALTHRITHDNYLDGNPTWSPDGRYLLYESDATGISNIYAYDFKQEEYFKITNVVGGAFQADISRDSRFILFRNASSKGFDIHEINFDPSTWKKVLYKQQEGYVTLTAWNKNSIRFLTNHSRFQIQNFREGFFRMQEKPLSLKTSELELDYSPWRTLLPFQDNWVLLPAFYYLGGSLNTSLTTFGTDILQKHFYSASLYTSYPNFYPNFIVSYRNDIWYPSFTWSYQDNVLIYKYNNAKFKQFQRRGSFGTYLLVLKRHNLGISYRIAKYRYSDSLSEYFFAEAKKSASIQFGYSYQSTRIFPDSVGYEQGHSISFNTTLFNKVFGGSFDELMFSSDGRLYINNPLFDNHVLALRLVFALALGPDFIKIFQLGGTHGNSIFSVQTQGVYPLRGFHSYDNIGTSLLAFYSEYRFPLWNLGRGFSTFPIYFKKLHMALFADAGNTLGYQGHKDIKDFFESAKQDLRDFKLGTGLELRSDIVLGWGYTLSVRFGMAIRLIVDGMFQSQTPIFDTQQKVFYFSFGTSI